MCPQSRTRTDGWVVVFATDRLNAPRPRTRAHEGSSGRLRRGWSTLRMPAPRGVPAAGDRRKSPAPPPVEGRSCRDTSRRHQPERVGGRQPPVLPPRCRGCRARRRLVVDGRRPRSVTTPRSAVPASRSMGVVNSLGFCSMSWARVTRCSGLRIAAPVKPCMGHTVLPGWAQLRQRSPVLFAVAVHRIGGMRASDYAPAARDGTSYAADRRPASLAIIERREHGRATHRY